MVMGSAPQHPIDSKAYFGDLEVSATTTSSSREE